MLPGLLAATLLASAPEGQAQASTSVEAKAEAKLAVDPDARLRHMDHKRVALHLGVRGYGRLLDAPPAAGGAVQLGLGVRLVRGLYITGEVDLAAHGLPVGAQGRAFLGVRHELRLSSRVRPSLSLGYSHMFDASFDLDLGAGPKPAEPGCGCPSGGSSPGGFGARAGASAELASRPGIQAGLGLRFPFRLAPRASIVLRGDAAWYFDDRPSPLQVGATLGFQLVF